MVSLLELAEITEEGVQFKSPHDGSMMMLTPEHSMAIQNSIGEDNIRLCYNIMFSITEYEIQLDDYGDFEIVLLNN